MIPWSEVAEPMRPRFLTLSQIYELDRLRKPGGGSRAIQARARSKKIRVWAGLSVLALFAVVVIFRSAELTPAWDEIARALPKAGRELRSIWTGSRADLGAVLVMDGQPANQGAARSALEREGYTVIVASNMQEATEVLAEPSNQVSVVIASTNLATKDTVQELKRLDPAVRLLAAAAGHPAAPWADGLIHRPYVAAELLQEVRRLDTVIHNPHTSWRDLISRRPAGN
jgi:CheY-like chemotaxis protein